MDTSEIRETLKCSMEIAHIRSAVTINTIIVAAYIGLLILSWGGWVLALATGSLVLIPLWISYGWRSWKIFQSPGSYVFCRAKLSQPHSGSWHHAMHFTVVLETEAKGKFVVNTASIFQTRGWLGPLLEDYVNREVTIAYNEDTETVVVIG